LIRNKIIDKKYHLLMPREQSLIRKRRANGGVLINPNTQDTRFELTKMDPALYGQVSNLKDDSISQPILDTDENGKKSFKIITVTNRINEHTADYATDYIKIKDLALKKKESKQLGLGLKRKLRKLTLKYL
jgi:peptidyl-prolyl cis-trans isomerase SurA